MSKRNRNKHTTSASTTPPSTPAIGTSPSDSFGVSDAPPAKTGAPGTTTSASPSSAAANAAATTTTASGSAASGGGANVNVNVNANANANATANANVNGNVIGGGGGNSGAAKSASVIGGQSEEDEVVCKLCGRMYNKPVLLNCGHTMCIDCADNLRSYYSLVASANTNLQETHKEFDAIVCLTCSSVMFISKSRTTKEALPPNQVMAALVEKYKRTGPKKIICSMDCLEVATVQCADCGAVMCSKCDNTIHRGPLGAHQRIRIDGGTVTAPPLSYAPRCVEHREQLKLFCRSCKCLVCLECANFGSHKGHEVVLINEWGEQCRKELLNGIQELKSRAVLLSNARNDLQKEVIHQNQALEALSMELTNTMEEIRRAASEKCTELMRQIEQLKAYNDLSIQERYCHLEKVSVQLQAMALRFEAILSNKSYVSRDWSEPLTECNNILKAFSVEGLTHREGDYPQFQYYLENPPLVFSFLDSIAIKTIDERRPLPPVTLPPIINISNMNQTLGVRHPLSPTLTSPSNQMPTQLQTTAAIPIPIPVPESPPLVPLSPPLPLPTVLTQPQLSPPSVSITSTIAPPSPSPPTTVKPFSPSQNSTASPKQKPAQAPTYASILRTPNSTSSEEPSRGRQIPTTTKNGPRKLMVKMWGAGGGSGYGLDTCGGGGGFVSGVVSVKPGSSLRVTVGGYGGCWEDGGSGEGGSVKGKGGCDGGGGGSGEDSKSPGGSGVRGGGGSGGSRNAAGGGGGASFIHETGTDQLLAAAGGGGGGGGGGSFFAGGGGGGGAYVGNLGSGGAGADCAHNGGPGVNGNGGGGGAASNSDAWGTSDTGGYGGDNQHHANSGRFGGGGGGQNAYSHIACGGGGGGGSGSVVGLHQPVCHNATTCVVDAANESDPHWAMPSGRGGSPHKHGNTGRVVILTEDGGTVLAVFDKHGSFNFQ
ncbi:tripartite motif-containing protein 9/67 [Pelomyxa schiedti]|nr:tripartite motif-containing protein 9/67 [Pelomyxa schiedti]